VEEPLYYNDVEVGNNMFNDDDDEALVFWIGGSRSYKDLFYEFP
jgi:hypothetical protein